MSNRAAVSDRMSHAQIDLVASLHADLLRGPTATAALQRRCGDVPVCVEVDRSAWRAPTAEQRMRLGVTADEAVGYRRVRLMAGDAVLSDAENWFEPARLTPAIRDALASGGTPFGKVIAPLSPTRRTLHSERLGAGTDGEGQAVLRHHALVIAANGSVLAEVIETYHRAAL